MFILYSMAMGAARSPGATEPMKSNSNMGGDPLKMDIKKKKGAQLVITGVTLASPKLFLSLP